jgi:hypothetical protein
MASLKIGAEAHSIWDGLIAEMHRVSLIMVGATTPSAVVNADEHLKRLSREVAQMRMALRNELAQHKRREREDGVSIQQGQASL